MSGHFELLDAPAGGYRVRLVDKSGHTVAVSTIFPTKQAAAAGITAIREIGGTGLVRDMRENRHSERVHSPIKPAQTPPRRNTAQRFTAAADSARSR
ncbi:DUF1508 domain-containing protein [Arthrobacter oryzae]|uniref:YegP family protein n=1 Tax=Arthrobacter oryzae TaxID=409290 RepID=UPI0028562570|nr:DUF1508 domain-containing protein [Arthrobacter oryzae]MDR6508404.1 uncharacterized protein YegP (UPF0339 family) [Arthrobacter oryzae]